MEQGSVYPLGGGFGLSINILEVLVYLSSLIHFVYSVCFPRSVLGNGYTVVRCLIHALRGILVLFTLGLLQLKLLYTLADSFSM